jgi:hypothetical protein
MRAFYDFSASPSSYDFVLFLSSALIASDDVHVVFVPADTDDGFRKDDKPISASDKIWRVHNILAPMCLLAGATYTICPTREEAKLFEGGEVWPTGYSVESPVPFYWYKTLKPLFRTFPPKKWQAPEEARRIVREQVKAPYITVTLRETYGEKRNSNKKAWHEFAWIAARDGYQVVIIPDTSQAHAHVGIASMAALNLHIRYALYEGAEMNFGTSGGPLMMCFFSRLPATMLKMVSDYYSATPEFCEAYGLPVGSQFPFRSDLQRLIWADDDLDNIKCAYKNFRRMVGKDAA